MHIVSNVEGLLKDGMTSMDVLRATFPAGTLSGAPKVHVMEVIDQLEYMRKQAIPFNDYKQRQAKHQENNVS